MKHHENGSSDGDQAKPPMVWALAVPALLDDDDDENASEDWYVCDEKCRHLYHIGALDGDPHDPRWRKRQAERKEWWREVLCNDCIPSRAKLLGWKFFEHWGKRKFIGRIEKRTPEDWGNEKCQGCDEKIADLWKLRPQRTPQQEQARQKQKARRIAADKAERAAKREAKKKQEAEEKRDEARKRQEQLKVEMRHKWKPMRANKRVKAEKKAKVAEAKVQRKARLRDAKEIQRHGPPNACWN